MKSKKNLIIPFAKQAGLTSFASMSIVKKSLLTKKVGHTGTLDLFADGLLVLLTGKLTRFAELISSEKKTYDVWIEFGIETDTLDPEGKIIKTAQLPSVKNFIQILPSFLGEIEQKPPEFSAIKINGKRASDRIRSGEIIEIPSRKITIFSIETVNIITENNLQIKEKTEKNELDLKAKYARIKVECSKGTYIRSLVRDIAKKIDSAAYVKALRRTSVGTFKLEEAAGFSLLNDFSTLIKTDNLNNEKISAKNYDIKTISSSEILTKAMELTPETAEKLNIPQITLSEKYLDDFYNGKKITNDWFLNTDEVLKKLSASSAFYSKELCVFCGNLCTGLIRPKGKSFQYEIVIPPESG